MRMLAHLPETIDALDNSRYNASMSKCAIFVYVADHAYQSAYSELRVVASFTVEAQKLSPRYKACCTVAATIVAVFNVR